MKISSILNDPTIHAELRAYIRSHKWALNPAKLKAFSVEKLIPDAAEKYIRGVVNDEIVALVSQHI